MKNPRFQFHSQRNPVYFIAEIGGNHEGDFAAALRLIDLAAESGADAVKFQIYSPETLVSPVESPERFKHFGKFALAPEQYAALAERCREKGVTFAASVWDEAALEKIDPYLEFYKIGSGDATAIPLLKAHARRGKPILLSTGLCTLEDVKRAVDAIAAVDPAYVAERKLALLQCTSMYPIPDSDANLDAMDLMRESFGLPVGYSDHTEGTRAILAAVAMGAEIIEAHFTDTRAGKTFRDHRVSLTRDEVKAVLEEAAAIKVLKGSREKMPTKSEIESGHVRSFRRSVYAKTAIARGEFFTDKNLTLLRPEHGLPAWRYEDILGERSRRELKPFEVLKAEDVEAPERKKP